MVTVAQQGASVSCTALETCLELPYGPNTFMHWSFKNLFKFYFWLTIISKQFIG